VCAWCFQGGGNWFVRVEARFPFPKERRKLFAPLCVPPFPSELLQTSPASGTSLLYKIPTKSCSSLPKDVHFSRQRVLVDGCFFFFDLSPDLGIFCTILLSGGSSRERALFFFESGFLSDPWIRTAAAFFPLAGASFGALSTPSCGCTPRAFFFQQRSVLSAFAEIFFFCGNPLLIRCQPWLFFSPSSSTNFSVGGTPVRSFIFFF